MLFKSSRRIIILKKLMKLPRIKSCTETYQDKSLNEHVVLNNNNNKMYM